MGGMHLLWWIFWIGVVLAFAWALRGRSGEAPGAARETPHELLRRRLANGECTPQEYENRKALLDRDGPPKGS
ncbi:MAG: SHOCT domain-containing protein [Burkholderiales bacterium]|nr:SHOCT domain-containing protein [Burkholderiales bacterium]